MKPAGTRSTWQASVRTRRLTLESLEERQVLSAAAPWHNDAFPLDTDNNSRLTPADALVLINRMLLVGSGALAPPAGAPEYYYDTNGDNMLSPVDVVRVINGLLFGPTDVTLDTLMPFTIDLTPRMKVITGGDERVPDGTPVHVDVDLNNDGIYAGDEVAYYTSSVFDGLSEFELGPALPPNGPGGPYSISMRARLRNTDGVLSSSESMPMIVDTQTSNALANYVNAPDASYQWSQVYQFNGPGFRYYVLQMTSQTWRINDVNDPVWDHWMRVVVPDGPLRDSALLYIGGGKNAWSAPIGFDPAVDPEDAVLLGAALANRTATVELKVVPNEEVYFFDEGPGNLRTEDEIIAYTLDKYMRHLGQLGNETWPLLLPMLKSAGRARYTLEAFVPTVSPGAAINDFFVTGYSKRGWTTWLTAAVDDRVRAIIPGVFDNPNQGPQMVHHVQFLGDFSLAVHDYTDLGIFERFQTPEAQLLSRIIDPYRYFNNGRFEIPKLVLNSAGDEFFVSDSSQFYFDDLPGDTNYMRYFPNTGHGLDEGVGASTITFMDAVLNDRAMPEFTWTVGPDGTIEVLSTDTPTVVKLWKATNHVARDFRRLATPFLNWTSSVLVDQGGGRYSANLPTPASGATAYLIELTYPSAIPGMPYVFTTDIKVKSPIPYAPWPYPPGAPLPLSAEAQSHTNDASIGGLVVTLANEDDAADVPLFVLPGIEVDQSELSTPAMTDAPHATAHLVAVDTVVIYLSPPIMELASDDDEPDDLTSGSDDAVDAALAELIGEVAL